MDENSHRKLVQRAIMQAIDSFIASLILESDFEIAKKQRDRVEVLFGLKLKS